MRRVVVRELERCASSGARTMADFLDFTRFTLVYGYKRMALTASNVIRDPE